MRKNTSRVLWALLIVGILYFFISHDYLNYLSIESIKDKEQLVQGYYALHPALVTLAFFIGYLFLSTLSLPGSALLTLLAGGIFGVILGTVLVSFASALGALFSFLLSRFLLRDWVELRYGTRLKAANEGLRRNGAIYLLSLRLIPAVPFFVVNLLMGVSRIRTWTFYWVTQAGMLVGHIVYVNAGTQLSKISSLREIFSPELIVSLAVLGILPVMSKLILSKARSRRLKRKR